jgi:catechol 2,3-dioxygenase
MLPPPPAAISATDVTTLPYGTPPPGYRLPAETRLGRVVLQIAELDRSVAFYTGVLGFRLLERTASTAVLGTGDDTPLVELHQLAGARPASRRGRLGLYHFAILLPDRASLGRFVAHLDRLGAYAGAADHLVSEALYLTDPDGLGIEVYADRPRERWEVRGREIVMATEPLDLADLVRAGGTEEWNGMPRGTAVGHVHLHVGDLQSAAAFYHQGLGLDAVVSSYPGALFLSAGGYHHHLGLNTRAGPDAAPAAADDARLLEWNLELPSAADAEAAAASLERAGHAAERDGGGWTVRDPWGTPLRLTGMSHGNSQTRIR